MSFIVGTQMCKERDPSLGSTWQVYKGELLPENAPGGRYTHVQFTGSDTSIFQRGPRKGQTKWTKECELSFIFDAHVYVARTNEAKESSQI